MAILAYLTQLQDHTIVRYAKLEIVNLPPRFHGNDPALALEQLVEDLKLEPDADSDVLHVHLGSTERGPAPRALLREVVCVEKDFHTIRYGDSYGKL